MLVDWSVDVSCVVTKRDWFVSCVLTVLLPESVSTVLYEPVMLLSVVMTVLESASVSEEESVWVTVVVVPSCESRETPFVSTLIVVVEPVAVSVEVSSPVISLPVSFVVVLSPDVSCVLTRIEGVL